MDSRIKVAMGQQSRQDEQERLIEQFESFRKKFATYGKAVSGLRLLEVVIDGK